MRHERGGQLDLGELRHRAEGALALVDAERGHVNEGLRVVGPRARVGDDRAAVGVADQDDRAVDLLDEARHVLAVVGEAPQRVAHGERLDALRPQALDDLRPAGAVRERAVDQDDGGGAAAHRCSPSGRCCREQN